MKLLGIQIESELTFNKRMETICKKARLCAFTPLEKCRILFLTLNFLTVLWFGFVVNTKINNLHYRTLRIVYRDEVSSFDELLRKDGSVRIHHRNLQCLAIEIFKVKQGLAPPFMKEIFPVKENIFAENVSSNTRSKEECYNPSNPMTVKNGLETLRCIGPKIWNMVPSDIKNIPSLSAFKAKIKKWIPQDCPCRLCRVYVQQLVFL